MGVLINGKELAKKLRVNLKEKIEEEGLKPKLAVILLGNDEASKLYVKIKSKACDEVGVEFEEFNLSEDATENELMELIEKLNNDKSINGILVQYPFPKQISLRKVAEQIAPKKDVDGFNPYNVGKLISGYDTFIPCTPYGIMKMFEEYKIDVEGKKAVIIGRSNIVGLPVAKLLLDRNATITIAHSRTKNLGEITKEADILIAAVGKPLFVKEDMVKENAVVIDVGVNRNPETNKLCGDVDFENVSKKASYITKVPGGVGPMTITCLLENTIECFVRHMEAKND